MITSYFEVICNAYCIGCCVTLLYVLLSIEQKS